MPVPKPYPYTSPANPTNLRAPGVAILIRYGAKLSPPKPDEGLPGIRCTQYYGRPDVVLVEAIGYAPADGNDAICEAAKACLDSGLNVSFAGEGASLYPARLVSRAG